MKKVIVLGAGLVGSAIAIDLSKKYEVTSADINNEALINLNEKHKIITISADLSDNATIERIVKDFDLVIGAVPGYLGYKVVENVINAGKNLVDISFFPEDAFLLDKLAIEKNVTAIVDCGVAPGMSNLIIGYHNSLMKIESVEIYVGGLPAKRDFPFEYKAPFSPVDVIEEYTRDARYIENGVEFIKPALSDAEYLNFESIGTLEAFNTDGLRSLMKTMKIPSMKEKTLRYPGHVNYIKALKECGFFKDKPINIRGHKIKPIEFTTAILFNNWKLNPEEEEFTVMRIIIDGEDEYSSRRITYDLFDKYDSKTKTSSMARTTGYTAAAAANLILEEGYSRKGIIPPEYIGENEDNFNFIINYLQERNIYYNAKYR